MYAEILDEAYANVSSISFSISPSPRRKYDPRVCVYFELNAFESNDI
jgi:hypothetical protein